MTEKISGFSVDECDLKILALLQQDARVSNAEIGRQLGMVPSAIFQRLQKLQTHGVIAAFEARIDAPSVGLGLAAFVFVTVEDRVGTSDTALRLAEFPEVQELHHVAGEDCYLLKVRVEDAASFGRFLREKIGVIESVRSTRTTIVLETLKETSRLPLSATQPGA